MSNLEKQIRSELERCADREFSLDAFRAWFVPVSWDIEKTADHAAIDLAHSIDGILAEASSGNWDEDTLREELTRIAHPFADSNPIVGIVLRDSSQAGFSPESSQRLAMFESYAPPRKGAAWSSSFGVKKFAGRVA